MSNAYSNHTRYAIRTLKNPTSLDVFVIRRDDHIELRVAKGYDKLPINLQLQFAGYLRDMINIIEEGGASVNITGINWGF